MVHPRIFIRQRWVLAAILCTSIVYFAYNTFRIPRNFNSRDSSFEGEKDLDMEIVLRKLKWHSEKENRNLTISGSILKCRNSVQGKDLVADDRGYVCKRDDLSINGCCNVDAIFTNLYDCDSCAKTNCCVMFEHCVSCCMRPDQKPLLQKLLRGFLPPLRKIVYSNIDDQFELCMTRCRTSSSSVQQENTYRDSVRKHCYGTSPPELHLQI